VFAPEIRVLAQDRHARDDEWVRQPPRLADVVQECEDHQRVAEEFGQHSWVTGDPELKDTPIIVVSALSGRNLAVKGAVAVFDKPIDPDEYLAAVGLATT